MFSPVAPRRVDALPRMLDCRLCFGCVGNPRISLRLVVARGFSLSEGELRCEGALRPRKGGGTWDYKLVLWGAVEPNPEATWRREIREITYTSDGSHSNAGFAQSRGRREWATEESTVSARILFLREHQRRLCCVGSREKVLICSCGQWLACDVREPSNLATTMSGRAARCSNGTSTERRIDRGRTRTPHDAAGGCPTRSIRFRRSSWDARTSRCYGRQRPGQAWAATSRRL
mmetsp:Transcript_47746/g.147277  ORF Transcript_47746/g.147277 Transcript_47746/m.147277 type:complete len:232 (+) Transcript_47746:178-873(+)